MSIHVSFAPEARVQSLAIILGRISTPGHVPTCLCNRCLMAKRKAVSKAGITLNPTLLQHKLISINQVEVPQRAHASVVRNIRKG